MTVIMLGNLIGLFFCVPLSSSFLLEEFRFLQERIISGADHLDKDHLDTRAFILIYPYYPWYNY